MLDSIFDYIYHVRDIEEQSAFGTAVHILAGFQRIVYINNEFLYKNNEV